MYSREKNKKNENKKNTYKIKLLVIAFIVLLVFNGKTYKDEKDINNMISFASKSLVIENTESLQEKDSILYEEYLREYSVYYNLNSDKVVEFAKNITNDFELNLKDFIKTSYDLDLKETVSMLFVYNLQKDNLVNKLSNYGLNKSYFKESYNITKMSRDLILRNGLSFSQFLGKISDLLDVNKYYALSISYLETGKVTSSLALNKNNFGGMRVSGEYLSYISPEAGIISFCLNLKGYEKFGLKSLEELSGKYVNGNVNKVSYTWINNVKRYYNNIIANENQYFV